MNWDKIIAKDSQITIESFHFKVGGKKIQEL